MQRGVRPDEWSIGMCILLKAPEVCSTWAKHYNLQTVILSQLAFDIKIMEQEHESHCYTTRETGCRLVYSSMALKARG